MSRLKKAALTRQVYRLNMTPFSEGSLVKTMRYFDGKLLFIFFILQMFVPCRVFAYWLFKEEQLAVREISGFPYKLLLPSDQGDREVATTMFIRKQKKNHAKRTSILGAPLKPRPVEKGRMTNSFVCMLLLGAYVVSLFTSIYILVPPEINSGTALMLSHVSSEEMRAQIRD